MDVPTRPDPHDVQPPPKPAWYDRVLVAIATGFGFGFSPILPGTVGSLWGLPLIWGVQSIDLSPTVYAVTYTGSTIVLFLVGVPLCARVARVLGSHDPGAVVYDEIIAFFVLYAFIPLTPTSGVLGFFYFRIFDITKLWPVRRLERFPGGWGVMADDAGAAAYGAVCLWGTLWVIRWVGAGG